MPEYTPDATFMTRSELDGFLQHREDFLPDTQEYLDRVNRQTPFDALDRRAMYDRANGGFTDDVEAESFSRLWAQ